MNEKITLLSPTSPANTTWGEKYLRQVIPPLTDAGDLEELREAQTGKDP